MSETKNIMKSEQTEHNQKPDKIEKPLQPVKVLFAELALNIGGAERVIEAVLQNADKAILKPVIAILGTKKGRIAEKMENLGVRLYEHLNSRHYDPRGIFALARIARKENVDIIYCTNMRMSMLYSWLAAKLSGNRRTIIALHNMDHNNRPRVYKIISLLTRGYTAGYVAVSQKQKEYFAKEHGISPNKIEVIYIGIDTEQFKRERYDNSVRIELDIPENTRVVGIMAMLRVEKNHELFINMAKLVSSKRDNICFLIVGDGPERQKLEALVDQMGLKDIVKFTGARSDVPEVLHAFDISVLTSHFEVMPISLQESMAMGIPIVSTNVGCIADEMVIDGVTGYLTPVGDAKALAEKVVFLLDNPDKAEEMGRAGRRLVEERFTKNAMVRHYEEYFIRIAGKA